MRFIHPPDAAHHLKQLPRMLAALQTAEDRIVVYGRALTRMPLTIFLLEVFVLLFVTSLWLSGAEPTKPVSESSSESLAASSRPTPTVAPLNYRLRPGDLVTFTVFNQPDLTGTARITEGGSISVPLIGELGRPVGRTIGELCSEIKRRLEADYLRQAMVQAMIVEYAPLLVSITGGVAHQGDIKLSPFQTTTALQAIASAGGFLAEADLKKVVVIRSHSNSNAPTQKLIAVPGASDPTAPQPDVMLESGDRIHVPTLEARYFFMVGKIKIAGMHRLPYDQSVTVSKAITMAGGFETFARQDRVQVLRQGKVVSEVDVRALLDGKTAGNTSDPVLEPGDTINISDSRY